MGTVYRAWDPRLKRLVALKFVESEVEGAAERFLREARAQASLSHPNVAEVFEVGEVAGRPYIAMQLIDGPSLGEAAQDLDLRQRVAIVRDASHAVHAAHERGLIHRDIKPSNVMLDRREDGSWVVKVVDFGLSRSLGGSTPKASGTPSGSERERAVTQVGSIAGTPAYMAPEQALGAHGRLDARTDVYALGSTLYELLARRPPFVGDSRAGLLLRVVAEAPEPLRAHEPAVPAELEAIVLKCLAKEPSRRFHSARALAEDLNRFLDSRPVEAFSSSPGYRLRKMVARHRSLTAVAMLVVGVLAVLVGIWLHTLWQADRQAELALRFGLQVDRVERTLWRVRSLPLHDVRPARARVARMLDDIARDMGELGAAARGPGSIALGRGHLALEDYEMARVHLQRAWDSGYRPPEAAYALGLTLGRLYQRALEDAQRAAGGAERERRRAEAERSLRDPALRLLRELPASTLEAPKYVEALIAYYEGRLEDALRKARDASAHIEWLSEAHVLEGRVLAAMAEEELRGGHYDRARQRLERADRAFTHAIAIAPSDVRAYAGQCSAWLIAWYVDTVHQRQPDPSTLDRLVDACTNGLTANAETTRLHATLARAYSLLADVQVSRREDPGRAVDKALEAAAAALALEPGNIFALTSRTTALWHRGQYQMNSGEDPTAAFDEAVATAEKAVKLDPRSTRGFVTMAIVLTDQASWNQSLGLDPRPWLRRSVKASLTAAELDPGSPTSFVNAAIAYRRWLEYLVHTRHDDPTEVFARAYSIVNRALEINPDFWWSQQTKGAFHTLMAEWKAAHGEDPSEEVEDAIASLERALELNPGSPRSLAYLGRAFVARASFLIDTGGSPESDLAAAEAAWQKGVERSPEYGELAELRRRIDALL